MADVPNPNPNTLSLAYLRHLRSALALKLASLGEAEAAKQAYADAAAKDGERLQKLEASMTISVNYLETAMKELVCVVDKMLADRSTAARAQLETEALSQNIAQLQRELEDYYSVMDPEERITVDCLKDVEVVGQLREEGRFYGQVSIAQNLSDGSTEEELSEAAREWQLF